MKKQTVQILRTGASSFDGQPYTQTTQAYVYEHAGVKFMVHKMGRAWLAAEYTCGGGLAAAQTVRECVEVAKGKIEFFGVGTVQNRIKEFSLWVTNRNPSIKFPINGG